MTINLSTIYEVRPTNGSDTNGGGFVPGLSGTDVTGSATLVVDAVNPVIVTSSAYTFSSSDVNKYLKVTSGTGWIVGWFQIISTSSGAATLDSSPAIIGTTGGTFSLYSGIDYSQQNSKNTSGSNISVTDGVAAASTSITSATANFTKNIVGNLIYIQGGSAGLSSGWYTVTAFTNSTTIVLDRTIVVDTGMTINIGGAFASIGAITAFLPNSSVGQIFVKSESTLTIVASITISATGQVPGATIPWFRIRGYSSNRGDKGRATIQASTNTGINIFNNTTMQGVSYENFILDCNNLGTSQGIRQSVGSARVLNCLVKNFTNIGINTASTGLCIVDGNEVTGGTSAATEAILIAGYATRNYVHDCSCPGINSGGVQATIMYNIVDNLSGATSFGIGCTSTVSSRILFNTVNRTGWHGINNLSGLTDTLVIGNIACNAGKSTGTNATAAYGLAAANQALPDSPQTDGNAFYSNKTGARNTDIGDRGLQNMPNGIGAYVDNSDVILTSDPFTNTSGKDYSLNSVSGGGAAAKNITTLLNWPGSSTTGYTSYGAVQPTFSSLSGTVGSVYCQ